MEAKLQDNVPTSGTVKHHDLMGASGEKSTDRVCASLKAHSRSDPRSDSPERSSEEDLAKFPIHATYEIAKKSTVKCLVNWNSIAKAHKSPEIEDIIIFLSTETHPDEGADHPEYTDQKMLFKLDKISELCAYLERNFHAYDFLTIERAIHMIKFELNRDYGFPSFLILYCLVAQIQHANLTMIDAWLKFEESCWIVNPKNFEILIKQAEAFKAQDTLEREYFLTRLLCNEAMKNLLENIDSKDNPYNLSEVFHTILPRMYFDAFSWDQALKQFNSQFGSQLGLKNFKQYTVAVMSRKMKTHLERHTNRIRRTLEKNGNVPITPQIFCPDFNEATGYNFEAVVLRDVEFTVLLAQFPYDVEYCENALGKCEEGELGLFKEIARRFR
ncbi:hypothetical protein NHQ30_009631 [Ciborinia camelliae]|nr:hypothetical protein NHQ30_009631 [Ciborinia camelliae]